MPAALSSLTLRSYACDELTVDLSRSQLQKKEKRYVRRMKRDVREFVRLAVRMEGVGVCL